MRKHLKLSLIGLGLLIPLTVLLSLVFSKTFDPNEVFELKEGNFYETVSNPKYLKTNEADEYLSDMDLGVSYSNDDTNRFYPYTNQKWNLVHIEGEVNYLVTYCEICNIAVIYSPKFEGQILHFEPTQYSYGKNTVMQDQETGSYWSQLFGESIYGELKGSELEIIFHQNLSWKEWKDENPDAEVMILN